MKSLFSYSKFGLAVLSLVGAALFASCKPGAVEPQPSPLSFASLRILNFTASNAGIPTVPLDVYFVPANQEYDTLAQVNNLQFGQASVYTNNLTADPNGSAYKIAVRPVRSSDKLLFSDQITLKAGHQYSYVVYRDTTNQTFSGKLVEDAVTPANANPTKQTYVRFMNVYPGSNLQAGVNGVTGDVLAPAGGLPYQQTSDYVALGTALDTTYAFYVYDPSSPSNILGKITYQSFAPGSFHTIVYAGDLSRTAPYNQSGDALDTLRVRVLDDNTLGNEETSPVPESIRYFIVNGMIPNQGTDPWWAYTVANDANPAHHGFTFDPVRTFDPVPNYGAVDGNGIQDAYFSSTTLSTWIDVKGYTVADANGTSPTMIFDVHAPKRDVVAENSYAIIFFDTIPSEGKKADSSGLAKTVITVPIPEQTLLDTAQQPAATFVFANAIAPSHYYASSGSKATGNLTSFMINGTKISGYSGVTGSRYVGIYPANQPMTISGTLGNSVNGYVDIGNSVTVTPKQGETYLVVSLGQRKDANFSDVDDSRKPVIKVFRVAHGMQ